MPDVPGWHRRRFLTMSRNVKRPVTCPNCGETDDVWDVEAKLPDGRKKYLGRECDKCGWDTGLPEWLYELRRREVPDAG